MRYPQGSTARRQARKGPKKNPLAIDHAPPQKDYYLAQLLRKNLKNGRMAGFVFGEKKKEGKFLDWVKSVKRPATFLAFFLSGVKKKII